MEECSTSEQEFEEYSEETEFSATESNRLPSNNKSNNGDTNNELSEELNTQILDNDGKKEYPIIQEKDLLSAENIEDDKTKKRKVSHAVENDKVSKNSAKFSSMNTIDTVKKYVSRPSCEIQRLVSRGDTEDFLSGFDPKTILIRKRLSNNVGVRSQIFEIPLSDPLPELEAIAIATVLQECLECLEVLRYVIDAEVDERWDFSHKSINEIYGAPDDRQFIFREDMDLLPLVPTVAQKLQKDRSYLFHVFEGILRDVKCYQRYDRLQEEVDHIIKLMDSEHKLRVNHLIWSEQIQQLRDLINFDKQCNEQEFQEYVELCRKVSADIDGSVFQNASKLGYVERWENARLEQKQLQLTKQEERFLNDIKEYNKLERADDIVSREVCTFLELNMNEMEEEYAAWNDRYIEEIDRREQEIKELKEKVDSQKTAIEVLCNLRADRQIFIDECNAEKDREKREKEYWVAVHRAATIVQSLWRGHMVRKQLGKYKGLWAYLKKRKKLAAIARKKREAWQKKKTKQWGGTNLQKLKNVVDPNA